MGRRTCGLSRQARYAEKSGDRKILDLDQHNATAIKVGDAVGECPEGRGGASQARKGPVRDLYRGQQCGRALGGGGIVPARGHAAMAAEAIDSGAAAALLGRWRTLAQRRHRVPECFGLPLVTGS